MQVRESEVQQFMDFTSQERPYAVEFMKKYKTLDNAQNHFYDHGIPWEIEQKVPKPKTPLNLFDKYKSASDPDKMDHQGVQKFIKDWGIDISDPLCIVFQYVADAKTSGWFSREEFNRALKALKCYDIQNLKKDEWKFRNIYQNEKDKFREVWKYTFAVSPKEKNSVEAKRGQLLGKVLQKGKYPLSEDYQKYIDQKIQNDSGFRWTKDEWNMSLIFL